jgi:hypothetical protein
MIKQSNIKSIGVFSAESSDLPDRQANFTVKYNGANGLSDLNSPEVLRDGTVAVHPVQLIDDYISLELPSAHIGGIVSSQLAYSNTLVKQNFAAYVAACEACAAFYADYLDGCRDKFVSGTQKKNGLIDEDATNDLHLYVDGLFESTGNFHLADHIAELFGKKYDNGFRMFAPYLNGSHKTIYRLMQTSKSDPETGEMKYSYRDCQELVLENNIQNFLFGQNLLHCIIMSHMNYMFGHSHMLSVFSKNWKSSTKVLVEQISQYPDAEKNTLCPPGDNPHYYFGRKVWSRYFCNLFTQRVNELTVCNKAFVDRVIERNKSDDPNGETQTALFEVYVQSFQFVADMYENHALLDKATSDMADCMLVVHSVDNM